MKVSARDRLPAAFPARVSSESQNLWPNSDLQGRPSSRKGTAAQRRGRNSGRVKRTGVPPGRRSRPETPQLKWKIQEGEVGGDGRVEDDDKDGNESASVCGRGGCQRAGRGSLVAVSARRLAAGLWRLQYPEVVGCAGSSSLRRREDQLGFQPDIGDIGNPFLHRHGCRAFSSEAKDLLHSPRSTSALRNGLASELGPSFQFSNVAMEGATKWDPVCLKTPDEVRLIYNQMKRIDQQVNAVSMVSAVEAELGQARARIQELETEQRTSKKKIEHFLKKFSEEKALWRRREHEKIRAFIDDAKAELNRERKNRQRLEIVNSKLVNELTDAKLSAKRLVQEYEKERKTRELMEEVCDELAKEIGDGKAEVEAIKKESMRLREEVDEERKMLQMAEVWREERVQMKLVDAKVALEEKYSQMNKLVSDIENFLRSSSATPDVKEVKEAMLLRQAAAVVAVNIQDTKDFSYDPPVPDDIFSILEEVNVGIPNEREIEPCIAYSPSSHASKIHTVSPEVNATNKDCIQRHFNAHVDQNGEIEDDESGWETVSHLEEQGSSYSPEGSIPSINKNFRRSNVSESGTDWEENEAGETPITEISEVCSSVPPKQLKKVSSIGRLWRSCPNNGENYKIIAVDGMNGSLSNGSLKSPERESGKGWLSPADLVGQWGSPDAGEARVNRKKKGWISRSAQKGSLKAKLLEARIECQKVQLRQVLQQKM